MKTKISITGQISGNTTLVNAIGGEVKKGMFNSFIITFPTKGLAVKAIRQAYKYLKNEEPEFKHGIKSNKERTFLSYDASQAKIVSNE